uniref:Transmembrane protein n=1 Tax=Angiostrongylus cantonensis TaxID=6313 RepID=A0A0K0D5C0_ANGCA
MTCSVRPKDVATASYCRRSTSGDAYRGQGDRQQALGPWCADHAVVKKMAAWVVLLVFPPVTLALLLVIVLASFGGTLGVRELFVECLTRIFEVGSCLRLL